MTRPVDARLRVARAVSTSTETAPLPHVALQRGQLRFGNREASTLIGDELVDDDERRRVVGAHEIARVHHQRAGAAGDRRRDRRVLQLDARVVDRGAIGGDRRRSSASAFALAVSTCSRVAMPRVGEIDETLRLHVGVGRLRDVALQVRFGLRERGLERPPVEREEHLRPRVTSSPSLKPTDVSWPVIWRVNGTVDEASTVPMTRRSSGIGLLDGPCRPRPGTAGRRRPAAPRCGGCGLSRPCASSDEQPRWPTSD